MGACQTEVVSRAKGVCDDGADKLDTMLLGIGMAKLDAGDFG